MAPDLEAFERPCVVCGSNDFDSGLAVIKHDNPHRALHVSCIDPADLWIYRGGAHA